VGEVEALTSVLGELGTGVVEVAAGPGLWIEQFAQLSHEHGVPVTWTALLARADKPGAALRTIQRGAALPGEVYPQMACRPIVMQITMADPTPLGEVDEWKEVLALPRQRRAGLYRDLAWRDRARPATLAAWSHERGEAKGAARFSLDTDIRRLFKDHVFGTFIEDHAGLRLLDVIGEDNVMLECDYPHSDSTRPDTISLANKWLGDLPEDVQHKITVGNAARVYDFTPADPASLAPAPAPA
jgi:Amidohydrolase